MAKRTGISSILIIGAGAIVVGDVSRSHAPESGDIFPFESLVGGLR